MLEINYRSRKSSLGNPSYVSCFARLSVVDLALNLNFFKYQSQVLIDRAIASRLWLASWMGNVLDRDYQVDVDLQI